MNKQPQQCIPVLPATAGDIHTPFDQLTERVASLEKMVTDLQTGYKATAKMVFAIINKVKVNSESIVTQSEILDSISDVLVKMTGTTTDTMKTRTEPRD